MKIDEVQRGDLVYLNSGSPALSVTLVDEDAESVEVMWMNERGEPQEATIPIACVNPVPVTPQP